ncbi:MAG: ArnT family glycosyltransferase [Candidatus Levyibacteriota bacterium]
MKKQNKHLLFLVFLTLLGIFFHFYNLNWGAPWYFHPDERNIATAVSQLNFPSQMNPHFFAYGSLPIYTIFFTALLGHFFAHLQLTAFHTNVRFEEAIVISRAYSALFATVLIPMLYILGKRIKDRNAGMFAALLGTFSVGMIQYAHYGTFELWLTFFIVCLFWHCLNVLNRGKLGDLILTALIFGVLVAIKVSSLALLPLPIFAIVFHQKQLYTKHVALRKRLEGSGIVLLKFIFFLFLAFLVYLPTNPYVLFDQKDFISSMSYESNVGFGTTHVFYTGGFFDTIPLLYQLLHVYPFLLNPLIAILFVMALCYLSYLTFKQKQPAYFLLILFYLFLFISQSILFVKWTRYLLPTLPFIYLIVALTFSAVIPKKEIANRLQTKLSYAIPFGIVLGVCMLFASSYFKTAFINPDSRIQALVFAKDHMPSNTQILSETYDIGIIPIQNHFPLIKAFNFYDLDSVSIDATEANLHQQLAHAEYIILPSQRVLQPRILNQKRFPKGHLFYEQLFNGALGYKMIYQTPCDVFCEITYIGDPVYWWEQTVNVFDRPTVFIFEKNK